MKFKNRRNEHYDIWDIEEYQCENEISILEYGILVARLPTIIDIGNKGWR